MDYFAGFAGIGPADVPGFIVAQLVGAVIALLLARTLFRPGTSSLEEEPARVGRESTAR